MTNRDLARRRRQLERLENSIRQRFDESETESVQALSSYDNHPADLATDTFHREVDLGLMRGLNRGLHRVRRALQKLDEGTYGVCERCGGPITESRLAALPDAIFCVACQAKVYTDYVAPPSEEKVVPLPYGNRPDFPDAVAESTGEDIWQALGQFGTSDSPQDMPPAVDCFETYVGFEEPIGIVEDVEGIVDEHGDVLFDTLRQGRQDNAQRTDTETDGNPD